MVLGGSPGSQWFSQFLVVLGGSLGSRWFSWFTQVNAGVSNLRCAVHMWPFSASALAPSLFTLLGVFRCVKQH